MIMVYVERPPWTVFLRAEIGSVPIIERMSNLETTELSWTLMQC
jgi:hypothetical protein